MLPFVIRGSARSISGLSNLEKLENSELAQSWVARTQICVEGSERRRDMI